MGLLEIVELDKAPAYVAVSYAWEGSVRSKVLEIPYGSISIAPSLYCALRNLRHPEVDLASGLTPGGCINQGDNKEKSSQVRLMCGIYSKAIAVIIDLGENVPARNVITRRVVELKDTLARIPADLFQLGKDNMIAPWHFEKHGLPHENDEAWQALGAILACPWFLRVWVMQEFVLAKDVALNCGGLAIPWELMSDALLRCMNHNISRHCYLPLEDGHGKYPKLNAAAHKDMQAAFELMRMRNTASHKRRSLLNLIETARLLLATRSRDHVFFFPRTCCRCPECRL